MKKYVLLSLFTFTICNETKVDEKIDFEKPDMKTFKENINPKNIFCLDGERWVIIPEVAAYPLGEKCQEQDPETTWDLD